MSEELQYFMLNYKVSADYLEKRGEYRRSHLELATNYMDAGKLLLGGAVADPADEAFLCFICESKLEVEKFVKMDPYYQNGLIEKYTIRKWSVVTGTACKSPVLPKDL